jgi:hypothetical protein
VEQQRGVWRVGRYNLLSYPSITMADRPSFEANNALGGNIFSLPTKRHDRAKQILKFVQQLQKRRILSQTITENHRLELLFWTVLGIRDVLFRIPDPDPSICSSQIPDPSPM